MPLSPADQAVLDEIWRRKNDQPWRRPPADRDKPALEWIGVAVAELTRDVEMHVWNQIHPPETNTKVHTAKAGTTVLIWAPSRFGDIGVTDKLLNAGGYRARVEPEALVNWRLIG